MMQCRRILPVLLIFGLLSGCSHESIPEPVPAEVFFSQYQPEASASIAAAEAAAEGTVDAIIQELAADDSEFPPGSNAQLIHDLYHLAFGAASGTLDTEALDSTLVRDVTDAVNAVQDMEALLSLWGRLYWYYGTAALAVPEVHPNPEQPAENLLYLGEFPGTALAGEYTPEICTRQLTAAGAGEDAALRAEQLTAFLHEIAGISESPVQQVCTEASLYRRTQHLQQTALTELYGLQENPAGKLVLLYERQFFAVERLLDDAHLQIWKDYTICLFLHEYGSFLPDSIAEDPRSPEEFAAAQVRELLGAPLGELYAQRCLSQADCETAREICREIRSAYADMIAGADRFSDEGRQALLHKLEAIRFDIGADVPHTVSVEDSQRIGGSLLDTQINFRVLRAQSLAKALSEPADHSGFHQLDPQNADAVYDPQSNRICIGAALLQQPFFVPEAGSSGCIGAVIAHEISHAFDSTGICYDAGGCRRADWLPECDREEFQQIMEEIRPHCQEASGQTASGNTVSADEVFADAGSLQCQFALAETAAAQRDVLDQFAGMRTGAPGSENAARLRAVLACFVESASHRDAESGKFAVIWR